RAAAVVLLDRLPAVAVPERHRVAALGVVERDAEHLADARQAVAGVLDEVRAEPELVALVAPVARPAAERPALLDERDRLALAGEERRGDEARGARADDGDVDLHRASRALMISTVRGCGTSSSSKTLPYGSSQ